MSAYFASQTQQRNFAVFRGLRRLVVCQHDTWFLYNNAKGRGHVRRWAPLFDKYNVDLALSGDDHNYLRTKPLKWSADEERFVPDGDGTVYMVA